MSQSTKESKLGPDQTLSRVSAAFPRVVYWLCMCPQLHLVSTHLIVKSNITSGGEACHEMTCENMVMSRKQINLNLSVGQLHVCAQRGAFEWRGCRCRRFHVCHIPTSYLSNPAHASLPLSSYCFTTSFGRSKNVMHYHRPTACHTPLIGWLVGCCLLLACLMSQQHASVSQGRICSDTCTCCHTDIEVADKTFYLTHSQYTDTEPTIPSTDPITPGACLFVCLLVA